MGLFGKKEKTGKTMEKMQREIGGYLKNSSYYKDAWAFFYGWISDGASGQRLHGNEEFYSMSMNPLNFIPADIRRNTDPKTKAYFWRFEEWSDREYSDDALQCLSELGFSKKTNSRYMGTEADQERRALCETMEQKIRKELSESVEPDAAVYVTRNQGAYGEVFVVAVKIRVMGLG